MPGPMYTLGTDGFGFSDTRPAARRHFLVDAQSIAVGTLAALACTGEVDQATVVEAARKYRIDDVTAAGPQLSDSGGWVGYFSISTESIRYTVALAVCACARSSRPLGIDSQLGVYQP